jgi:methyl-accepting chemotaxis protein
MVEIAASSHQQNQGVEQINSAIEQMNQLTQQTAANAEESASTSQELSSQTEGMRDLVTSFHLSHAQSDPTPSRQSAPALARRSQMKQREARTQANGASRRTGSSRAPNVEAEKLIPFDDDNDFGSLPKF